MLTLWYKYKWATYFAVCTSPKFTAGKFSFKSSRIQNIGTYQLPINYVLSTTKSVPFDFCIRLSSVGKVHLKNQIKVIFHMWIIFNKTCHFWNLIFPIFKLRECPFFTATTYQSSNPFIFWRAFMQSSYSDGCRLQYTEQLNFHHKYKCIHIAGQSFPLYL